MIAARPPTPAVAANVRRNARASWDRPVRWKGARDALWDLLDPLLAHGGRVAVVGAGNADDVPLTRLAARAAEVHLIDLDRAAARAAIRREPRALRRRLSALEQDVTAGAADRIVTAALSAGREERVHVPEDAIGTGSYDLVVGDLLYTQLLFPALLDAGIAPQRRARVLQTHGQPLTDAVVRRLHAAAPAGFVVHVHDVAGWWPGRTQPLSIDEVLEGLPDPSRLVHRLVRPGGCDPEVSLRRAGVRADERRWWRWPFSDGVTYLVQALVSRPRTGGR